MLENMFFAKDSKGICCVTEGASIIATQVTLQFPSSPKDKYGSSYEVNVYHGSDGKFYLDYPCPYKNAQGEHEYVPKFFVITYIYVKRDEIFISYEDTRGTKYTSMFKPERIIAKKGEISLILDSLRDKKINNAIA